MAKKGFSSKEITMKELGEFTEAVILPGVEAIVDKAIEKRIKPIKDRMGGMESKIMAKLDNIDFKISSQNEQSRKDAEAMHEWVQDIDERVTSLEAKR